MHEKFIDSYAFFSKVKASKLHMGQLFFKSNHSAMQSK